MERRVEAGVGLAYFLKLLMIVYFAIRLKTNRLHALMALYMKKNGAYQNISLLFFCNSMY